MGLGIHPVLVTFQEDECGLSVSRLGICRISGTATRTIGQFRTLDICPIAEYSEQQESNGMTGSSTQFPYQWAVFGAFVLFVFSASAIEIMMEFVSGEAMEEMADDLVRFVLSAFVLAIFVLQHYAQRRELADLRQDLSKARGQLARIDPQSVKLGNQYRQVMQKQFDAWDLSASEQDVVIGMLKGLSFREIAEIRGTREKTVRQQASSVYRKAGVGSRNELSAWFFEDMLEPLPETD